MKLSQIQHKNDWFYEARPILILLFGVLGLLSNSFIADPVWLRVGQVCGAALIYSAIKIYYWRHEYRSQRGH